MAARLELKYVVDLDTRLRMQEVLRCHMVPGEFVDETGGYPVLSLYYDGEDLPLYMEKIAGLEERMKVRLRTYGWSFDQGKPLFLEAKMKQGNLIAKRRLDVARERIDPLLPASWDGLGPRAAPFLRAREELRLVPSVQVWYQREVLASPGQDLRVTWDYLLRASFPGETMDQRLLYDATRAIVPDHLAVLEIKAAQTLPAWLARLMRQSELVPQTFSKYVRAIDTLGISRRILATC